MSKKKRAKKRDVVAAPALPPAMPGEPIPAAFKLEHGQRLLVDASMEEMIAEMRRRIPAFLLSYQGERSTLIETNGRWAEVVGLHVLTANWIAQPSSS